ncbi:hypothetical protein BDZ91DRAFT_362439 [Kalaharituber pfeilii]|nr:hypothetical protein BDZ91DRAFT_362439 [Kalaharituber pfeilii]
MIPGARISIVQDLCALITLLGEAHTHIQLSRTAGPEFSNFKKQLHDLRSVLHQLHEIISSHEQHLALFDSGAARAAAGEVATGVETEVQRTLPEIVGDFSGLQKRTERFLKRYGFLVEVGRESGSGLGLREWIYGGLGVQGIGGRRAWKKVSWRVLRESAGMFEEMKELKRDYVFYAAKVQLVLEPLRVRLMHRFDRTLNDIRDTVNRIEQ